MNLPEPSYKMLSDKEAILLSDYTVMTSLGLITISKGFLTDGLSIPQWCWSLIGETPFTYKAFPAGIIHDALYQSHSCSYLKANDIFYELLKVNNVAYPKRSVMYHVLDAFGWIAYYKYDLEDTAYFKQFVTIIK